MAAERPRKGALTAVDDGANGGEHRRVTPEPPGDLEAAGLGVWEVAWSLPRVEPADGAMVEQLARLQDEAAQLRAALAADGMVLRKPIRCSRVGVVSTKVHSRRARQHGRLGPRVGPPWARGVREAVLEDRAGAWFPPATLDRAVVASRHLRLVSAAWGRAWRVCVRSGCRRAPSLRAASVPRRAARERVAACWRRLRCVVVRGSALSPRSRRPPSGL